jgi:hypothetical protein
LLGRHGTPLHRPALILLFAKKFFRSVATALCRRAVKPPDTARRLQPNEVDRTNILAPGFVPALAEVTFFPPSPPRTFRDWPNWEVVSSYSSATAPDSHGISCADPLFQARKELNREVAVCTRRCKIYFGFNRLARSQTSDRVQQLSCRPPAFLLVRRKLEGLPRVSLLLQSRWQRIENNTLHPL